MGQRFEQFACLGAGDVLEHGYRVRLVPTDAETHAVDTEDDLRCVEQLLESDPLVRRYL